MCLGEKKNLIHPNSSQALILHTKIKKRKHMYPKIDHTAMSLQLRDLRQDELQTTQIRLSHVKLGTLYPL